MRNNANYLDYIPRHNRLYPYSCNEAGHIEILVHNKGLFHGIARIFLDVPNTVRLSLTLSAPTSGSAWMAPLQSMKSANA